MDFSRTAKWVSLIDEETDAPLFGAAVARLARAHRSGVPLLPGFALSTLVAASIWEDAGVKRALKDVGTHLHHRSPEQIPLLAAELRMRLREAKPANRTITALEAMVTDLREQMLVTDLPLKLSCAGDELSIVLGKDQPLLPFILDLLSLQLTDTRVYARLVKDNQIAPHPAPILVQYYPKAAMSGEVIQMDTRTHDATVLTVTARPGMQGFAQDDTYRFDAKRLILLDRKLERHWVAADQSGVHHSPKKLTSSFSTITDEQAVMLARAGRAIQQQFSDEVVARWIWTDTGMQLVGVDAYEHALVPAMLQGTPGEVLHMGFAIGPVFHVHRPHDWRKVRPEHIVFVQHLSTRMGKLPMCAGIVSAHASQQVRVSAKRHHIPLLGGVTGLADFKQSEMVTLDALQGQVLHGVHPQLLQTGSTGTAASHPISNVAVLVDDALLYAPAAVAPSQILLRPESVAAVLRDHPERLLAGKRAEEYQQLVANQMVELAAGVPQVQYQLHDLHSHKLLHTRGAMRHEINPTMGNRGAHRLLHEPELLEAEVAILKEMVKQLGDGRVAAVLPMIRHAKEAIALHTRLRAYAELPIWVRIETPAALHELETMLEHGIDGVYLDLPALAELMLGIDREHGGMTKYVHYPVLLAGQVSEAISLADAYGVPAYILFEGVDPDPALVQAAISAGAMGVVCSQSNQVQTAELLASIERRVVLEHFLQN